LYSLYFTCDILAEINISSQLQMCLSLVMSTPHWNILGTTLYSSTNETTLVIRIKTIKTLLRLLLLLLLLPGKLT